MKLPICISGILLILFASCTRNVDPEPIKYGEDQCVYCKMSIADPNYGAAMITDKGRDFKYDAAECLVNHLEEENLQYQGLYVVAYDDPKKLYPIDSLLFIVHPDYRSPMGENLAAFVERDAIDAKYLDHTHPWNEVSQVIKDE